MNDPFVGTWKRNPTKSNLDPNHQPREASLVFELDAEGRYVMKAAVSVRPASQLRSSAKRSPGTRLSESERGQASGPAKAGGAGTE